MKAGGLFAPLLTSCDRSRAMPAAYRNTLHKLEMMMMMKDLSIRAGSVAVLCAALGASVAGCGGARVAAVVARPQMPYVIGADDVLTVTFWQDRTPMDVVVRPDGKISMPLLNDLQAAGHTPEQLAGASLKRCQWT